MTVRQQAEEAGQQSGGCPHHARLSVADVVMVHQSLDCTSDASGVLAKAWRTSKAADFASRAQCLGTNTHPEVLRLLQCIAHETAAVDAIWIEQQATPDSSPWWADGEYDVREADR
jgi:hypothetical protein